MKNIKNAKKLFLYSILIALIGGSLGVILATLLFQANLSGRLLSDIFNLPLGSDVENSYQSAIDYEQTVIQAVEKASPAVVSIIISKDLPIIEKCPVNPFVNLPQEFQDFFDFGPLQFYQSCQKGFRRQEVGGGSGFMVSGDGYVATNEHVVSDSKAEYTILTNAGDKYAAKVLARDSYSDLAILKIKVENSPFLNFGDSDALKLGQTVIAIGNALGEFRNTVSVGIVSGLARNITAEGNGLVEAVEGVIQTDAAINLGNSGGPLLNLKGEAIGINTALAVGAQNIGFAIPINQVKRAINSVRQTGKIVVPYLGVRYVAVNASLAEKEKLPVKYGVLVRSGADGPAVMPNSPAAKAGIKAGDIILEINRQKIDLEHSLTNLVRKYAVGDTVTLKIQRDNRILILDVVLEARLGK